MKVKISFTLEYDDPKNKDQYDEIITEVNRWIDSNHIFNVNPITLDCGIKNFLDLQITSDYKG